MNLKGKKSQPALKNLCHEFAIRRQSNASVVCNASVFTQPTHLWRAWCTRGQPEMCQLKPRHNLKDRMGPAISPTFTRLASTLSHCLSLSFFSNQVRFYQAPAVSNRYRLWNFRRQSVWEPQYQLCSSRPAPLQTRGRFLKRREKLHKEHIGGRFNTNWQWKCFIQCSTFSLCFLPLLCSLSLCKNLCQTVLAHCEIDLQRWEITFWKRPPFAWICWADMEKKCEMW